MTAPTAIGYIRVSTDQQCTERQRLQIREYCRLHEMDLREIVEEPEAVSGRADEVKRQPKDALDYYRKLIKDPDRAAARPGLRRLFARLGDLPLAGRAYVIFYALDRLSRDATELLLIRRILQAWNCEIVALNAGGSVDASTASGWLQFVIQAMLAEFECLQISERTSATLQNKVKHDKTVHVGRPPVGWRKNKETGAYEHDPEKWLTVAAAVRLRGANFPYAAIATQLSIPRSSVKSYLDAYHWQPPSPGPVSAAAPAAAQPPSPQEPT